MFSLSTDPYYFAVRSGLFDAIAAAVVGDFKHHHHKIVDLQLARQNIAVARR